MAQASGPRRALINRVDAVVAQRVEHGAHDAGSVQPCIGILLRRGVVILIDIGQAERANLKAGIGQAFVAGQREHMAAETANRAFLDGDQHIVGSGELADQGLLVILF